MIICKSFTFEAAHRLPYVPPGHKCGRLHGHSYRVDIALSGPIQELGWVVDYAEIKRAWEPLNEVLDHNYLNEIPGLENPTSELLAQWIWFKFAILPFPLHSVTVHETCTTAATYPG